MCRVMIELEDLLKRHPFSASYGFDFTSVDEESASFYDIGANNSDDSDGDEVNEDVSHENFRSDTATSIGTGMVHAETPSKSSSDSLPTSLFERRSTL